MNDKYLLYTGALRVFNDFSQSTCENFNIEHDINNPKFEELRNQYPVIEIAGEGNDLSKATNIMRWIYDNILHCGGATNFNLIPKDPFSILNYSFGKDWENGGVYCGHKAIVFVECCRSVGLSAWVINGLPFSPHDFDNHVLAMVYINELAKWVLFDQSNNAYFTDKNGVALSPLEARYLFGIDEICVSEELQPFHKVHFIEKVESYKEYMAKNLFYIKFWTMNTLEFDLAGNETYYLIPLGFNVKEREIALEWFKGGKIHIVSQEQFVRIK